MPNEKIRIFAVDDEEGVLSIIKKVFEKHDVTTELHPLKAVEKIKQEKFDIVIVDYQMPVMNGIELLEEIKEIYGKNHYIGILCTAYGTIHLFKDEFSKNLFSYFVEKPFDIECLKDIMKRSIAKLKRMKENTPAE